MNKKFGILFVFVLLAGAVFLSACQSEVGARINRNVADNRQIVNVRDNPKISMSGPVCDDNEGNGFWHGGDWSQYMCIYECDDGFHFVGYYSDTDDDNGESHKKNVKEYCGEHGTT